VQGVSKRAARREAPAWFERFGLEGFETAHPCELSGGMRQRAALLRTVLQQRSTLLLDEPFGALHVVTRQEQQQWLQLVWDANAWTALLVTRDVRETILLPDRIMGTQPEAGCRMHHCQRRSASPRGIGAVNSAEFIRMERSILQILYSNAAA